MFYVGVDYYPEHWPVERWETDAKMMQEAGFNIVRLAEFAWIKMEPHEGVYDFTWLDEAVRILHKHGIKVIMGTPTGSMPIWAATKYPETVAVNKEGQRLPFGGRKTNCPTSLSYRLLSNRITKVMTEHYKNNPAVIGWQTDNEMGGPVCYCDTCKASWYDWLEHKFGTIDKLNNSWGTIFWGHTYNSWNEVAIPNRKHSNPSLELNYSRFHSHQVVSFQNEQIDIIKHNCKDHFVTHNLMGFFETINYFDFAEKLDFVSFDYYYNYSTAAFDKRLEAYILGAAQADLMRSIKHKNYWVMETTSGPIGSEVYSRNTMPGEMRRLNLQSIAHGASGLLWFRWRTSRFGYEQYWHGLLGHDGIANRRYAEAATIAHEVFSIGDELETSETRAKVAIAYSYDDIWAFKIQPNSKQFKYINHTMNYYKSLYKLGIDIDFIDIRTNDISKYKVLIAPTMHIITSDTADKLEQFVDDGGILVLTFRSGVKDEENVPYDITLPALLKDMCGIRIDEYEALIDNYQYRVSVESILGTGDYHCSTLADWIINEKANVLLRYNESHVDGYAAATVNDYGNGQVYYIGTLVVEDEFYTDLIEHILGRANIKSIVNPVEGLEVVVRYKGETPYLFLLNHRQEDIQVIVPEGFDLLTNQQTEGKTTISAGNVMIVKVKISG